MRRFILLFMMMALAGSLCGQPLETVGQVDLRKYAGHWFEIAAYPAPFEKGCHCATAEYEFIPGRDFIRVVNRCIRFRNGRSRVTTAKGKAYVVENSGNARLRIQFFWPFRGDYYIIGLAEDYSWTVVGHPGRKYLWFLSRESYMTTDTYNRLRVLARDKGYDLKMLRKTPRNCDILP